MMRERTRIASAMDDIRQLEREANDASELWEMAQAEGDVALFAEVETALKASVTKA